MTKSLILIPARMASTRLPGKPMADIAGLPMILQVVERAREADIGEPVVATDSSEILSIVEAHGAKAVMTREDHESGSDRIWEAVEKIDPDGNAETIINLQGDLPAIDPVTSGKVFCHWKTLKRIFLPLQLKLQMKVKKPILMW